MAALWALQVPQEPVCAGDGGDAVILSYGYDVLALTVSKTELIFSYHRDVQLGLTYWLKLYIRAIGRQFAELYQ